MGHYHCDYCGEWAGSDGCSCGFGSGTKGCKDLSLDEIVDRLYDLCKNRAENAEEIKRLLCAYKDKTGQDRPGFM